MFPFFNCLLLLYSHAAGLANLSQPPLMYLLIFKRVQGSPLPTIGQLPRHAIALVLSSGMDLYIEPASDSGASPSRHLEESERAQPDSRHGIIVQTYPQSVLYHRLSFIIEYL